MSEFPTLHHPSQYRGMTHHADSESFLRRGGSFLGLQRAIAGEIPSERRWIVSFSPITYSSGDCRNATEVMEAAWALFDEGGWTIHIWDTEKQEGWSYMNFGPGCIEHLERFLDGQT